MTALEVSTTTFTISFTFALAFALAISLVFAISIAIAIVVSIIAIIIAVIAVIITVVRIRIVPTASCDMLTLVSRASDLTMSHGTGVFLGIQFNCSMISFISVLILVMIFIFILTQV